jgi:hypothetical protein
VDSVFPYLCYRIPADVMESPDRDKALEYTHAGRQPCSRMCGSAVLPMA